MASLSREAIEREIKECKRTITSNTNSIKIHAIVQKAFEDELAKLPKKENPIVK